MCYRGFQAVFDRIWQQEGSECGVGNRRRGFVWMVSCSRSPTIRDRVRLTNPKIAPIRDRGRVSLARVFTQYHGPGLTSGTGVPPTMPKAEKVLHPSAIQTQGLPRFF